MTQNDKVEDLCREIESLRFERDLLALNSDRKDSAVYVVVDGDGNVAAVTVLSHLATASPVTYPKWWLEKRRVG